MGSGEAFEDHGTLARTVDADFDGATATFEELSAVGVDAADVAGPRPVLLIASDTPQVTSDLLTDCANALLATDVVFGLARDGGWWVLGVTGPAMAQCLHTIPTSRSTTTR